MCVWPRVAPAGRMLAAAVPYVARARPVQSTPFRNLRTAVLEAVVPCPCIQSTPFRCAKSHLVQPLQSQAPVTRLTASRAQQLATPPGSHLAAATSCQIDQWPMWAPVCPAASPPFADRRPDAAPSSARPTFGLPQNRRPSAESLFGPFSVPFSSRGPFFPRPHWDPSVPSTLHAFRNSLLCVSGGRPTSHDAPHARARSWALLS